MSDFGCYLFYAQKFKTQFDYYYMEIYCQRNSNPLIKYLISVQPYAASKCAEACGADQLFSGRTRVVYNDGQRIYYVTSGASCCFLQIQGKS